MRKFSYSLFHTKIGNVAGTAAWDTGDSSERAWRRRVPVITGDCIVEGLPMSEICGELLDSAGESPNFRNASNGNCGIRDLSDCGPGCNGIRWKCELPAQTTAEPGWRTQPIGLSADWTQEEAIQQPGAWTVDKTQEDLGLTAQVLGTMRHQLGAAVLDPNATTEEPCLTG